MSKVAVVGSRSFRNYRLMVETLDEIDISEIISGGAYGADKLAERYALERDIPTTIFKPEWITGTKYNPGAGKERNTDIVNSADIVVAFWDGQSTGTADSIRKAQRANKQLIQINF